MKARDEQQGLPNLGCVRRIRIRWLDSYYWVSGLWLGFILRSRIYRWTVKLYYAAASGSYETRAITHGYDEALDSAIDTLRALSPPTRILDACCGTGLATLKLAKQFRSACIVGVDLSSAMLCQAHKRLGADDRGRVRFTQADITNLPFRTGEFDLVVLQNGPVYISELKRVVSTAGGILIVFSFGQYIPRARLSRYLGVLGQRAHIVTVRFTRHGLWVLLSSTDSP